MLLIRTIDNCRGFAGQRSYNRICHFAANCHDLPGVQLGMQYIPVAKILPNHVISDPGNVGQIWEGSV